MICRAEFTYEARGVLAKKSADLEFYATMVQLMGDNRAPTEADRLTGYNWPSELILSLEEVQRITDLGVPVNIKKLKGSFTLDQSLPQGKVNVYVTVPHVGLFAVNEVLLEEDCCTDKLQSRLDDGWHLLCVCPPNAARRPDYILGRTRVES